MLYETFAASSYCTNEFKPGDRDYIAALQLAEDIVEKLNAAYVQAIAARKRLAEHAGDEIKDLLAEQAWERFTALQDLANENPNVRTFMARLNLSHILTARDPGA